MLGWSIAVGQQMGLNNLEKVNDLIVSFDLACSIFPVDLLVLSVVLLFQLGKVFEAPLFATPPSLMISSCSKNCFETQAGAECSIVRLI